MKKKHYEPQQRKSEKLSLNDLRWVGFENTGSAKLTKAKSNQRWPEMKPESVPLHACAIKTRQKVLF